MRRSLGEPGLSAGGSPLPLAERGSGLSRLGDSGSPSGRMSCSNFNSDPYVREVFRQYWLSAVSLSRPFFPLREG